MGKDFCKLSLTRAGNTVILAGVPSWGISLEVNRRGGHGAAQCTAMKHMQYKPGAMAGNVLETNMSPAPRRTLHVGIGGHRPCPPSALSNVSTHSAGDTQD
jgi:hypothetical protein